LYVEANEPSLENRRIKPGMQYATKMKAYPSNPAHECVFNPLYENVYDKPPNTIQLFGLRVNTHFENSDINLDDIAPIVIPENQPWLNPKPTFNFELTQQKKSETNPLLIQQQFAEIRSVTSEYSAIYTDGDRVASAAVFGQQVYSARIPSASSIFSAEANAILLALKFVASSKKSKFMICSDSLSCLLAIESCTTQNPFILKIVEIYKSLVAIGKHVMFTWIPSHIGIHGNTVVDREAKNALDDPVSNCSIPLDRY
jgi:ribonuclease HI